jgi:hypothetical protein
MVVDPLADLTSNQNAPSTVGADSYWLMGISTKHASNHMTPLLLVLILIGGTLSLHCRPCHTRQKADSRHISILYVCYCADVYIFSEKEIVAGTARAHMNHVIRDCA